MDDKVNDKEKTQEEVEPQISDEVVGEAKSFDEALKMPALEKLPPKPKKKRSRKTTKVPLGKTIQPKSYEVRMITDKWTTMTDEEMAENLPGRKAKFVTRVRKNLGLYHKDEPEYKAEALRKLEELPEVILTPEENGALRRLENSPTFQSKRPTLSDTELDIYKKQYVKLILSLGDLSPTEEDNLHLMITELIRQDRILAVEASYKDDPQTKNNPKGTPRSDFNKQYDDSISRYRALQKSLKASREQRLEGRQGSTITLVSIVQELNSERGVLDSRKAFNEIIAEREQWEKENGPQIIAGV